MAFAGQTFLKWQNDRGGLNGRKFEYKFYDDSLDAGRAVEAARTLIKQDKIFAFYSNGTVFTQSQVNSVAEPEKVPTIGTTGWGPGDVGSEYVFTTGLRTNNAGHIMAQMSEEFFNKPKRPGMVSTDIDLSQQCASEPRRIYQKLGRPVVVDAKPTLTDPDYTPYILQLRSGNVDAVFFCIDSASLLRYYRAAQRQNFNPPLIAVHANYDYGFRDQVGPFPSGKLVVEAGPMPPIEQNPPLPRIAEYQNVFIKYNPDKKHMIHAQPLAGWAAGFVLLEALQRAGLNPTRQSLLESAKSIVDFNWGFGRPYTAQANAGWLNYDGFKVVRDPVQCAYAVEYAEAKFRPRGGETCLDKNL